MSFNALNSSLPDLLSSSSSTLEITIYLSIQFVPTSHRFCSAPVGGLLKIKWDPNPTNNNNIKERSGISYRRRD
ncbi:hypothetical protein PIB30_037790 [Stylosanthes scabra]|uniref:Uncharacterized protein n=1 Tax=Stylosanthes scabra TaxID=79078 RepID=A0ABU6XEN6_9FABA|nr:hypothetical protein [Stylosanthes scabra]